MKSKLTAALLLLALALGGLTACGQANNTTTPGASPGDTMLESPEASPGDMLASPEASPAP